MGMFDMKKVLGAVTQFGGKVLDGASQYAPAMMNEDKRFSNSYSAILSLLVCADLEVEADETVAAIGFMQNDPRLRDKNLVVSSLEFYGAFIGRLAPTFDNKPLYLLEKAKIIEEHIVVDLSASYKLELINLCNQLVGQNANSAELMVRDEILIALR